MGNRILERHLDPTKIVRSDTKTFMFQMIGLDLTTATVNKFL